ncbi:hypothetical protein [Flagellimonas myxillae]|nr:hypothetical protein [Muricauda myxillae]
MLLTLEGEVVPTSLEPEGCIRQLKTAIRQLGGTFHSIFKFI